MDNGALVTESITYAKEALVGKWTRWLIFIICSLPFALIPFVFNMEKITDGATFRWDLVPWGELAVICIAGFLLSFILSGYLARVYRGVQPAPEFDNWGVMYMDGIRIAVVGFLWFIPLLIVLAGMFAIIMTGFAEGSPLPQSLTTGLVLFLLIIEIAVGIIAVIYSMMGIVRCARTSSIREGIRFSAVTETLRAIGWTNYLVALAVLLVVGCIFFIILALVSLIPYAGWAIELALTPLYSVFSARYLSKVYDQSMPQPAAP